MYFNSDETKGRSKHIYMSCTSCQYQVMNYKQDSFIIVVPDDGIHFQEQIHHGEQEGILSKNNQGKVLHRELKNQMN